MYQIKESFEDDFPESWIDDIDVQPPLRTQNLSLLRIVHKFGDERLIALLCKRKSEQVLWNRTFNIIIPTLSARKIKILVALYLFVVRCTREHLSDLLSDGNITSDLLFLRQLHLVDSDLTFTYFWIPVHLHIMIKKYQLIPENDLITTGQELLQKQITILDKVNQPDPAIIRGFQYCTVELARLGIIDNPLRRNIQFVKKLSSVVQQAWPYLLDNMVAVLELALLTRKGRSIQKALFSLVDVMRNLPLLPQTIDLCEWLLKTERKHRNWALVSEIQIKMAAIYSRSNRKEKAIGLISSAIQLNNDIKNYSSKYQNLITIALLLLDLGEFEKLGKLVGTANFDFNLLNQNDIAKLWLIDGHILFHDKKNKEAEKSLLKTLHHSSLSVPDSLLAKTHMVLAKINLDQEVTEQYMEHIKKASVLFELAGDQPKALELHDELSRMNLSSGNTMEAITHLEWLLDFSKRASDSTRVRDIADQLGGLYFKMGDKSKSASYYTIAQGI